MLLSSSCPWMLKGSKYIGQCQGAWKGAATLSISVLSIPDVFQQSACWATGWEGEHELLGKWLRTALHFDSRSTWSELTTLSTFLIRFSFHWGISPASFLHFLEDILSRYLQESLFGNSLSQVLRKMWKRPTQQDLSISYPIVWIFPSLLPAITLGLVQDQSILTVLRNVHKMSLRDLLRAWPLESPMFWDSMSL